MAIIANIGAFESKFVASLTEGHNIEATGLRELG